MGRPSSCRKSRTHRPAGSCGLPNDDPTCANLDPDGWDDPQRAQWKVGRRREIVDQNYLAIYRRSVYPDYEYSPVAERALVLLVELIREWGGKPVLVLMPVSEEMNALHDEMVEDRFSTRILEVADAEGIELLDLRRRYDYDLKDVNHLSSLGARDVSRNHFAPIVAGRLSSDSRAQRPAGD